MADIRDKFFSLWGKTGAISQNDGEQHWHPLICHCLDVAAIADALLAREPAATREKLAVVLGLSWFEAQPWLLLLIAAHDLGKATPAFQRKWQGWPGQRIFALPRQPDFLSLHGVAGQVLLLALLRDRGWTDDLAELAADAVASHHGNRATNMERYKHENAGAKVMGGQEWYDARCALFTALEQVFSPSAPPTRETLDGQGFMLIAGLTSFSDWMGSNEVWFPYADPADCQDLPAWYAGRRKLAEQALDAVGWLSRFPLCAERQDFQTVFGFVPRPLQAAVAQSLTELNAPAVLLVEAPMGEGKTEAAYYAHLELQRRFDHRGLYVALPTQATGNAMFSRTLSFLNKHAPGVRWTCNWYRALPCSTIPLLICVSQA